MPQIHIKLDNRIHKELKNCARKLNFSLQDLAEKSLSIVANDPSKLFSSNNATASSRPLFTFSDLFAGIGGIRIAFEKCGGRNVFSSEWDRWCQRTYLENFAELPEGDLNNVSPKDIPDHDILTAGFPCQPFSIAGVSKKKSLGLEHGFKDKAQGTLFFTLANIIESKRPKMFMLENVKNLKSHDKGNTLQVIKGTLEELNYTLFMTIIDARYYIPQHRERFFIVGLDKKVFGKDPTFTFPNVPKGQPKLDTILEKKVDQKYVLSDKLWNYLQGYAEKHRRKGNGFGYGLFSGRDTARTLSARYYKDGSEILIKVNRSNPRRLTPPECAKLMGFPKSFKIPVSDTQAYKQFGNSVAVPVVEAVAKKMVKTYKAYLGKPE